MAKGSKSRNPSTTHKEVTPKADTENSNSSPPVRAKVTHRSPPQCAERPHPLPQPRTQPTATSQHSGKHPAPDVDLRTEIATGFSEIMKELRSMREEIRAVREEVKLVRSEVGSVLTTKKKLGDNVTVEATDRNKKRGKSAVGTVKSKEETLGGNLMADVTNRNEKRKESKMGKKETLGDNLTAKVTDRNKEREESEMGMERLKIATRKEEASEDWCFICKDGGELRICDYKHCSKSYHGDCVWKEDAFLGSLESYKEDTFLANNEDHWCCGWHYCTHCRKSSNFRCYTCPKAVCSHCVPMADFLPVKKEYGFCDECLKLVFLIEENKNEDSDGDTVDFTDRETEEGMFMEYYMIIKCQERFNLSDLRAAENQRNNKKSESSSDLKESNEEETSDGDSSEKRHRGKRRRKESNFMTKKCKKMEFVGWASKPLIEFLASIGKSGKEELSKREVASIVNDYVKDYKLLHLEKKWMIVCDERLQALFGKKTLNKHKVSGYLEAHFAEKNIDDSKENKRQKVNVEKDPEENERAVSLAESFAAIVVENMKLVYLKRIWLNELVNEAESFKEKVTGSFVRIKSNSDDSATKNSHKLLQVTGIKDGEIGSNTVLLLSAVPGEIPINQLADGDITTEECEELRLKMVAGELERPTVGELQKKANLLHEDITHFKIKKELSLLKNKIEHANEKGWRRQLFEYFDRRRILQSPTEVAKMIESLPTVIPELLDSAGEGNDVGPELV